MVLCFAVFHEQDLLIRRHTSCCCLLEPSCQHFLCWLSWVVLFAFVAFVCFVWFLFCLWVFCVRFCLLVCTDKTSDCNGLCPLSNPQRGIQCMHMRNSFNQHNNVRRPGESHRGAGRKKYLSIYLPIYLSIYLSLAKSKNGENKVLTCTLPFWYEKGCARGVRCVRAGCAYGACGVCVRGVRTVRALCA